MNNERVEFCKTWVVLFINGAIEHFEFRAELVRSDLLCSETPNWSKLPETEE